MNQAEATLDAKERMFRTFTWLRVPLMTLAFFAVLAFIHDLRMFWYGAPVVLFGELIQMWASSQLLKDRHLTISGPYSHVRNPMYIGRFVLGLGFFIMIANPYVVAGYVVLFAIYAHLRAGREEARLKVIFKPDYQHYCSEIRRWLPRLKPYSRSEAKNASWKQLCANHENINLMVVIFVLALTYLRITHISWTP